MGEGVRALETLTYPAAAAAAAAAHPLPNARALANRKRNQLIERLDRVEVA